MTDEAIEIVCMLMSHPRYWTLHAAVSLVDSLGTAATRDLARSGARLEPTMDRIRENGK